MMADRCLEKMFVQELDVVLYALEAIHGKAEGADVGEDNFKGKCLNGIGFMGGKMRWYLRVGLSSALFDRVANGESATHKKWGYYKHNRCVGTCNENGLQPVANFYNRKNAVDGLYHCCIACEKARRKVPSTGGKRKF
jgi:hypothetical protein